MNISEEDRRLLARAAAFVAAQAAGEALTPESLAALTRAGGLDFATAVLYESLVCAPGNAAFAGAVRATGAAAPLDADLLAVVPGAFHREQRHTGADGARVVAIARQAGCATAVVPTASFGGLAQNAAVLLAWLARRREQRIVLLSLSKGGAEVKTALASPLAAGAFANVGAWVSLGGMVRGTPLIRWLRRRPHRWWVVRGWLWWKGHGARALYDLRHQPAGSGAGEWPPLPPHLRVVHVYGFPLRGHLAHPWAARGYARLAPLGPNDGGGILLADLLGLPGVVCPVWGADHYLAPHWEIAPRLRRIIVAAAAPGPARR